MCYVIIPVKQVLLFELPPRDVAIAPATSAVASWNYDVIINDEKMYYVVRYKSGRSSAWASLKENELRRALCGRANDQGMRARLIIFVLGSSRAFVKSNILQMIRFLFLIMMSMFVAEGQPMNSLPRSGSDLWFYDYDSDSMPYCVVFDFSCQLIVWFDP